MADNNAEDSRLSDDTMKILVATDIHLGYMEKDGCRSNDSLNSFEEILQIAKENDVDFVLLGGDLFHENKPSRRSLHGCIRLLRKYCFGAKPCPIEFLSDPSVNFGHTPNPIVNYEDPNLNISIPVFSIHGNHDDPAGQGNLCSLDLLHAAGLVNYFGKVINLESIELSPLLLQKGATKMALYGLGSIRDERLNRIFCHKNLKMLRPKENKDDWFSTFVLHQNRSKHGPTNYIPEQYLDDFLDLIVWGHEHECKIEPSWNGVQNFYVTQPGSSIATSLSDGETKEKHVGLLYVHKKNFKMKKIKLKTVRQFYMEDIILGETRIKCGDPDVVKKVEAYCSEIMERLLATAEQERIGYNEIPEKPLIRLRIDYSGEDGSNYELFSIHRFGQKYIDRVANPKDIVHFFRRKLQQTSEKNASKQDGNYEIDVRAESLDSARVEDMVRDYFLKAEKNMQLNLLTEQGISDAVREFVDKEERDAIQELVKYQLQKTQEHLKRRNPSEDALEAEVIRFKEERRKNTKHQEELQEVLSQARASRSSRPANDLSSDEDTRVGNIDDDIDLDTLMPPSRGKGSKSAASSRGRGEGRGRGSRGRGRGSRGGRGGATAAELKSSFIDESFNRAKPKQSKRKIMDDDEEDTIIDDDDDDEFGSSFNKPKSTSTKTGKITDSFMSSMGRGRGSQSSSSGNDSKLSARKNTKGKGVAFNDEQSNEDDDDEFDKLVPQRKKSRF